MPLNQWIPKEESRKVASAWIKLQILRTVIASVITVVPVGLTAFFLFHQKNQQKVQIEQQRENDLLNRRVNYMQILYNEKEVCEQEKNEEGINEETCKNLPEFNARQRQVATLAFIEMEKLNGKKIDLSKAKLSNIKLRGVDLRGADLIEADFFLADLNGANLYGADLSGASLNGARLSGTNLTSATLSGSKNIPIESLAKSCDLTDIRLDLEDKGRLDGYIQSDENKQWFSYYDARYRKYCLDRFPQ